MYLHWFVQWSINIIFPAPYILLLTKKTKWL